MTLMTQAPRCRELAGLMTRLEMGASDDRDVAIRALINLARERGWVRPDVGNKLLSMVDNGAALCALLHLVPDGWHWSTSLRDTPYGENTGEAYIYTAHKLTSDPTYVGVDEFGPTPEAAMGIAVIKLHDMLENTAMCDTGS